MSITIPEHDELVSAVQHTIIEAVDKEGWPLIRELCEIYGISAALMRKLYLWKETDRASFNLKKMLEAHDLAQEVVFGRKVKKVYRA